MTDKMLHAIQKSLALSKDLVDSVKQIRSAVGEQDRDYCSDGPVTHIQKILAHLDLVELHLMSLDTRNGYRYGGDQ